MKKKFLTVLIAGVLCISMVACNKSNQESSKQVKTKQTDTIKDNKVYKLERLGVEFKYPNKWENKKENVVNMEWKGAENIVGEVKFDFYSTETNDKSKKLEKDAENDKAKTEKLKTEFMNLYNERKKLCEIVTIDKSKSIGNSQKKLFSQYENKDLIGSEGNFEFYFVYNNKLDTSGLSEKSKKDYEEIFGEVKNLKKSIKTFKPVAEKRNSSNGKKIEFKTKTLDGKEIDSSIFKDNKLTMINIWGTFCGPCINEMPDIQKLYEEVKKDKINIIGIVSDTPDEDNEALAKKILEKKGVKFTNIIPDASIKNNLLKDVTGVPATLFVDSKGNIVGEAITGSHSKEDYKREIEARLKSIK